MRMKRKKEKADRPTIDLAHEMRMAIYCRDRGDAAAAKQIREEAGYVLGFLEQRRVGGSAPSHNIDKAVGFRLGRLKDALPHGQFLPWCRANGINPRAAQRWMQEASTPSKRGERLADQRERQRRIRQTFDAS